MLGTIQRNVLFLAYALVLMPHPRGATYRGVRVMLGLQSDRAVRTLVARAVALGLAERAYEVWRGHERALVRPTGLAARSLAGLFGAQSRTLVSFV